MSKRIKYLQLEDQDKWQMSFVMPSKYGANLPLPKDPSVRIKEVPKKVVAVVAFSGLYVLCLLKGVRDLLVNKKIRKIK